MEQCGKVAERIRNALTLAAPAKASAAAEPAADHSPPPGSGPSSPICIDLGTAASGLLVHSQPAMIPRWDSLPESSLWHRTKMPFFFHPLTRAPSSSHLRLKPFQLVGLNWLVLLFNQVCRA